MFNHKKFSGSGGRGGERRGGGGKGAQIPENYHFLKLGFTCNLCRHHRTVLIQFTTGYAADFKSGTHPENGDPHVKYQIVIPPGVTQDEIIKAVGDAHQQVVHPNASRVEVVNIMN